TSFALPEDVSAKRAEVSQFRDRVRQAPPRQRHQAFVDEGYLFPHWPPPWGQAASAIDQLVIEETLADVDHVAALDATFWEVPIVLPTVLDCGTDEQIQRWMRPSMLGEIRWCQ